MELRKRDLTEEDVEIDFSHYGKVDNVTINDLGSGLRVACVDFKNPPTALNAKRDMQEKGDYGTITFWEVRQPSASVPKDAFSPTHGSGRGQQTRLGRQLGSVCAQQRASR